MARNALRIICILLMLAALACILVRQPKPKPESVRRTLHGAMLGYLANEHEYPYDPRGPEYALYGLSPYYDIAKYHAHRRTTPKWPESDDALSVITDGKASVPPPPVWNHREGRVLLYGVEYLNAPPQRLLDLPGAVVVMSYNTAAWSPCAALPVWDTDEYWYYDPWVRPLSMMGLPAKELHAIDEYGRRWGVACDF